METYFPRLRRRLAVAAITAPLLVFAAFLCVAGGMGWWAAVPGVLAAVLLAAFPGERASAGATAEPGGRFAWWMGLFSTILLLNWLILQPEIKEFFDRIGEAGEAMWDWRLVLAVFAWTSSWSYSNYCKVRALKDRDILEIYDEEDGGEPCSKTDHLV